MKFGKLSLILATLSSSFYFAYAADFITQVDAVVKVGTATLTAESDAVAKTFADALLKGEAATMKLDKAKPTGYPITYDFLDGSKLTIEKGDDDTQAKASFTTVTTDPAAFDKKSDVASLDSLKADTNDLVFGSEQLAKVALAAGIATAEVPKIKSANRYQKTFTATTAPAAGNYIITYPSKKLFVKVEGSEVTICVTSATGVDNGPSWTTTAMSVGFLLVGTILAVLAAMLTVSYMDPEGTEYGKANNVVASTISGAMGGGDSEAEDIDTDDLDGPSSTPRAHVQIGGASTAHGVSEEEEEPISGDAYSAVSASLLLLLPFLL